MKPTFASRNMEADAFNEHNDRCQCCHIKEFENNYLSTKLDYINHIQN